MLVVRASAGLVGDDLVFQQQDGEQEIVLDLGTNRDVGGNLAALDFRGNLYAGGRRNVARLSDKPREYGLGDIGGLVIRNFRPAVHDAGGEALHGECILELVHIGCGDI